MNLQQILTEKLSRQPNTCAVSVPSVFSDYQQPSLSTETLTCRECGLLFSRGRWRAGSSSSNSSVPSHCEPWKAGGRRPALWRDKLTTRDPDSSPGCGVIYPSSDNLPLIKGQPPSDRAEWRGRDKQPPCARRWHPERPTLRWSFQALLSWTLTSTYTLLPMGMYRNSPTVLFSASFL